MQISLYIGRKKKKDRIVDDELEKYIEGDRSDRIKDLILKGLIFEGRKDIDNKLLDMRYIYNNQFPVVPEIVQQDRFNIYTISENESSAIREKACDDVDDKPDFADIKLKRAEIVDDELESRI